MGLSKTGQLLCSCYNLPLKKLIAQHSLSWINFELSVQLKKLRKQWRKQQIGWEKWMQYLVLLHIMLCFR